jgi:REP element-mobilizing transposase RayT
MQCLNVIESNGHAAVPTREIEGGIYFFTITLADRSSDLLVRHIEHLRKVYKVVEDRHPFETIAICVLPDHVHAVWSLPSGDSNFPVRWSQIKSAFSRELPAINVRSASKTAKRDKGIWQRRYWEHVIRNETIWSATSTTFTVIRSSMAWWLAPAIGPIAAFIATLHVATCRSTGVAMGERSQVSLEKNEGKIYVELLRWAKARNALLN